MTTLTLQEELMEVLEHFHPASSGYGGYPIRLPLKHKAAVLKEYKGWLKSVKDIRAEKGEWMVAVKDKRKLKAVHTAKLLTEEVRSLQLEVSRLYKGMELLQEGYEIEKKKCLY